MVAALALGIALGAFGGRFGPQPASDDPAIEPALARSHFLHVTLRPLTASAPAVKLIYARDGSWAYAIVDAARTCEATLRSGAGAPTTIIVRPHVASASGFRAGLALRSGDLATVRCDGVAIAQGAIP
jgi:hypothetical protein